MLHVRQAQWHVGGWETKCLLWRSPLGGGGPGRKGVQRTHVGVRTPASLGQVVHFNLKFLYVRRGFGIIFQGLDSSIDGGNVLRVGGQLGSVQTHCFCECFLLSLDHVKFLANVVLHSLY